MSYPVGRSAFAGGLFLAVGLGGLLVAVAWAIQADAVGWRQFLAFAAVAACGATALRAWLRAPVGTLRWNGATWQWQAAGAPDALEGQVVLALDLQQRMLLRWRGEAGGTNWLWLQRDAASADWDALRRAVYSRAGTPVPFPGKPPAADP